MSYHRKHRLRRRSANAMGSWNPFAAVTAAITGASTPAPAPATTTIEMPDDFAGNVANLPSCPYTDANGWCNQGGKAVHTTVNLNRPPTTSAYQGSAITDFFKGLTGVFTPPSAPAATAPRPAGMSTTTKLAIAGAGVAVIALLAARR